MARLPLKCWTLQIWWSCHHQREQNSWHFLIQNHTCKDEDCIHWWRLNVMTQDLHAEEGALPQCLMVQNAYTKMCNGSKSVTIVVRSGTAYPQTLKKKIQVARVIAANLVSELQMWPGTIDILAEAQGVQAPRMTMGQRQEKLFENLDLGSLESWPPELTDSTHSLLAEYHDIFSIESGDLGCTHSTEHVIKVTDDAPLKEQFRKIPLPLGGRRMCTPMRDVRLGHDLP